MKMKLSPEVIVVIILFILVIFIANYGSCKSGPSTYNSVSTFSKQFAYEGFVTNKKEKEEDTTTATTDETTPETTPETTDETTPETTDEAMTTSQDDSAKEPTTNIFQKFTNTFTSLFSKEKQEESFTTMSPSQVDDAYKKLDVVGDLPANAECIGKSHGYSKSTGGVCWDEQTEKLLLSRGGQSCGSCTARR